MKPLCLSGRGLLLLLLASPAVASASAEADQAAAPLRWAQVVAAVAQHPRVREAEARVGGATGAIWSAEEIPNPVVTITGADASARNGPGSRREWGYSIELPLEFLATRGSRVASARATARSVEQDALGVRAQVLRALRHDFVALAHAQARLDAELELEAQLAQLAALVRRRAERGEARPTEVPRVEIEVERLRSAVDRARSGAEALRQRLSTWLGAPVRRVEADLAQAMALPPLDGLQSRLTSQAPAMRAGEARITAASEALSAERWDRLPKLAISHAHVEELDRSATAIAATLTVPLWNWNGGRIRQAGAQLAAERASLDEATRELLSGVTDAWQACSAGQAATRRFRDGILPRAEESARTMGRAFELGEAGLLDVIDTRRVLLDSRREYLGLLLEMQNACGDLAALAGLELS